MAARHPLPEINVTPLVDVVLVLRRAGGVAHLARRGRLGAGDRLADRLGRLAEGLLEPGGPVLLDPGEVLLDRAVVVRRHRHRDPRGLLGRGGLGRGDVLAVAQVGVLLDQQTDRHRGGDQQHDEGDDPRPST